MKKNKAMAWLLAAGMALSACPMVALAEQEPAPKASSAVFSTPAEAYGKQGAELGKVDFIAGEGNAVAVTGTLNYVTGYTEFNASNPDEQQGYFLAFDIKPEGVEATENSTIELSTYNGDADKNAQLTKDGFMVMRIVKGANFTVSVDWDGPDADAYEKTTYNFDLSKLGRQSVATFEQPAAQMDLLGKKAEDLQNVEIKADGTNVKVTGALKFVTDYTQFSNNEKEQSGNYFAFTVKAPEGVTMNDEKVVLKMINSAGTSVDFDKADGTMVVIMNALKPFSVVVDWDGEETKYAETTYTINPSELKVDGRITPGADSEVKVDNGYVTDVKAGMTNDGLKAALEGAGGDIVIKDAEDKDVAADAKIGTGFKVQVVKDGVVLETVEVVIAGDTDGDGEIQVLDAIKVLDSLTGDAVLSGAYEQAALVAGNQTLSVLDAIQLLDLVVA